jgi:hypothetical protein
MTVSSEGSWCQVRFSNYLLQFSLLLYHIIFSYKIVCIIWVPVEKYLVVSSLLISISFLMSNFHSISNLCTDTKRHKHIFS